MTQTPAAPTPQPPRLHVPFRARPWKYRVRVLVRRHRPVLRKIDPWVKRAGVGFSVLYLWLLCFVVSALLMSQAFKWAGDKDGFAVIQAFGFLAAVVTLIISWFDHPILKRAAWTFGIGALGVDQAGDLAQKFFEGSAPFKNQAVQFFLQVEIGSAAVVLATAVVLAIVSTVRLWKLICAAAGRLTGQNGRHP
jgi:hypothetical protein